MASLPGILSFGLFRGRVLERVLVVSLLAAVLPVAVAGLLSHKEVTSRLELQAESQLREMAKSYGLGVLERLKITALDARRAAAGDAAVEDALGHRVLSARFVAEGEIAGLGLSGFSDRSTAGASPRRSGGRPLLLIRPHGCCGSDLLLAVSRVEHGDGMLLLELNPDYIWGVADNLPYLTDLCAFDHRGQALFCNREISEELGVAASSYDGLQGRTNLQWHDGEGNPHLASIWELFLAGDFLAPPWTFVVSQPLSYVTRAADSYQQIFAPVLGFVALLVIALASRLVRRSLAPLEQLTDATRSLAGGDLGSRVQVATQDEFRELASSFNTMAERLGDQFEALRGLSQLDHLMLRGAELEEVGKAVIAQMRDALPVHYAGVLLVDSFSDEQARLLLSHAGEATGFSRCRFDAVPWSGFDSAVEVSGRDSPHWPALPGPLRDSDCRHAVVLPFFSDGEIRGLMLLGDAEPFEVNSRQRSRLAQLGDRLALAQSAAKRDEALYRQAHFDDLTGLPNRQLMMDRLHQQILHAERESVIGAVLFIDLDRFKQVNDAWGHGAGDQLLYEAGQRIRQTARNTDTVARIGGDEFVVLMSPLDDVSEASSLANRLIETLSTAFRIGGSEHFVSASVGITIFPDDGNTVERILRNADTAMYRAKDAGRGRLQYFSESMNRETIRRVELERELRRAIESDGLRLHYQPQVDIDAGKMYGVEALVRWPHPERGLVPAGEFISIAEDSGLIVRLGEWVMETAWAQFDSWSRQGMDIDCVSVNISRRQFRDPNFVSGILASVERAGVDPSRIELEITETAVAADIDAVAAMLGRLREVGFRIAIDDFGIGYSSLSQLQQLPFDTLKIDKSFVDRLARFDRGSRAIVRAIITLAEHMEKTVIAEGVETHDQATILRADGCQRLQGYLFGKPVPAAEIPAVAAAIGGNAEPRAPVAASRLA